VDPFLPPHLAAVNVVGFMVSRYFGLRSYGEMSGCMFIIFTVGTGLGRVLTVSVLETRSYKRALAVFGVALMCASVLVSRLGRYNFPARPACVGCRTGREYFTQRGNGREREMHEW